MSRLGRIIGIAETNVGLGSSHFLRSSTMVLSPFSSCRRRRRSTQCIIALLLILLVVIPTIRFWVQNKKPTDEVVTTNKAPVQKATTTCHFKEILSIPPNNHWTRDKNNQWVWHNDNDMTFTTIPNNLVEQAHSSTFQQPSLVLYGSSHLRSLYFHLLRIRRNLNWNAPLDDNTKKLGSGNVTDDRCDPQHSGWSEGLYGVHLEWCGMPGKRIVPELHGAIGFKTFLHTPDADDAFLEFLQQHHVQPTILVVDVGIWGPRGRRHGSSSSQTQTTLTRQEEIDYYLNWIQTHFANAVKIFVHDRNVLSVSETNWLFDKVSNIVAHDPQSLLWRKDLLLQNKPQDLPCGHGCEGPLLHLMAQQLLTLMQAYNNTSIIQQSGCE